MDFEEKKNQTENGDAEIPAPKRDYSLPVSILVAAILISGSILYAVGARNAPPKGSELAALGAPQAAGPRATLEIGGRDVVLGDPNAPVAFIEYGDYQCPFCAKLFNETEGLLRDEYVKTGKVKMVYRDFPLDGIHPYARPAAEAAQCAKDQGKFWAFHDALYERQAEIPSLKFASLAGELGMDSAAFGECVDSGKHKDAVEAEFQSGISLGVNSTPTVFVNGEKVIGSQPYETFKEAIERALSASG
ncbi:DsbA family protein [Candidatus Parcubacteria bacterium]|nr:MAG: DsbA family protein [Candidatus Parcubacteria bacterium]